MRRSSSGDEISKQASLSSISDSSRFGGLIPETLIQAVTTRLLKLTSFLDATNPPFFTAHAVVTIFRALQLIGPALCAGYPFWGSDTIGQQVTNIFAVSYHIVPPQFRDQCTNVVEFVFAGLIIGIIVFMMVFAVILERTGQLPLPIRIVLAVYFVVIAPLANCIALEFIGESIGRWIAGEPVHATTVVAHALTALAFVLWLWLDRRLMSISLLFRPSSFQTVASAPGVWLVNSTFAATFVLAVGMHLPKWPQVVLLIVGAAIYVPAAMTVFRPLSFVRPLHQKLVLALATAASAHCVIVAICTTIGHVASQAELLLVIAVIGICAIVSTFIIRFSVNRQLDFLEQSIDNPSCLDQIPSIERLLVLVTTGMQYGHQVALDWSLFRHGIDRWPDCALLFTVYAKFVAVYPEESTLLTFLLHTIVTKEGESLTSHILLAEGIIVQMQQELALSARLKSKLGKIQKEVASTKRKLRNIWDLVIQGNISEMENSVTNAHTAVRKLGNDFRHLLAEYPNYRFVARAYARTVGEIAADYTEMASWRERIRLLQRGVLVTPLTSYQFGIHAFPLLPRSSPSGEKASVAMTTDDNIQKELLADEAEDETEKADHVNVLRDRIDELSIPAIRAIHTISILELLLVFVVPAIAVFVYAPVYLQSHLDPMNFMFYLSKLRSFNFQLPIWAHYWLLENIPMEVRGGRPLFSKAAMRHRPEYLGYELDVRGQLEYLLMECIEMIEGIDKFMAYKSSVPEMLFAQGVAFSEVTPFHHWTNNFESVFKKINIRNFAVDNVMRLSELIAHSPNKSAFEGPALLNPVLNAANVSAGISEALRSINFYTTGVAADITAKMQTVEIVLLAALAVVWISLLILQKRWLHHNKIEVYKCLTALPKNVVSQLSESLRVLKKSDSSESHPEEGETEVNKHEEKLLKIFATAGDSKSSTGVAVLWSIIPSFAMLGFAAGICVILCKLFPDIARVMNIHGPHLDDVLGANAYMLSVFLQFNDITAAAWNGYDGLFQNGVGDRKSVV
jgi:hypothetical protein